ncbi:hypothetical protein HK104_007829, partial [Borealophlyctis nickersoniae]
MSTVSKAKAKAKDLESASRPIPVKTPFWTRGKRNCCIACCLFLVLLLGGGIPVFIFIGHPVLAGALLYGAELSFQSLNITSPQNDTLDLGFHIKVSNTGPFSADVSFPNDVNMFWTSTAASDPTEKHLLAFKMSPFSLSGGVGEIDQLLTTSVTIVDTPSFSLFLHTIATASSFTWRLRGNATITSLLVTSPDRVMDKSVTLTGFKSFSTGVVVKPGDMNVTSGNTVTMTVTIPNPSILTIELPDIAFDLSVPNPSNTSQRVPVGTARVTPGTRTFLNTPEARLPLTVSLTSPGGA